MEAESFDTLAATLRADARDLKTFMEVLADKLATAFPDSTKVERGGLFGGGPVRRIDLGLDEHRYRLEVKAGRATGSRARVIRGIVVKNEELDLEAWIRALSRDLTEAAETSERDRAALERLLSG